MDNLSIDFYDEANAAVSINWAQGTQQARDPEARRFADALLFACYTLQQFRNLGGHPSSKAIAENLDVWMPATAFPGAENEPIMALPSHVLLDAALDIGMTSEHADQ